MSSNVPQVPAAETPLAEEPLEPVKPKKTTLVRIIVAFWLLGLCNNYTYVIMLSAAHDIIHKVEQQEGIFYNETEGTPDRNCTKLTTGAILLADILPTLVVKLVCPFLPFFVHFRLLITVVTGVLSLILVGASESITLALVGVCFASFNSGLGEVTLLAYSTSFVLHALAAWSSGTGGAGLAGSFAYAGMTEGGLTPEMSLYISIIIPVMMGISFWAILKHPPEYKNFLSNVPVKNAATTKLTFSSLKTDFVKNMKFIPKILHFMIPVGLVYYFEYLINSGLFDKFDFKNTEITKESQFRWFNGMYQMGVFVSRSSVTWIHFKKIWVMSLLQGINFIVLFLEAIYGFFPNVWIMFVFIFWEGLLGGAAYVNTFYNMSFMVEEEHRLFALSIASVADTFGIVLSGVTTFPVHSFICGLPFRPVFRWP